MPLNFTLHYDDRVNAVDDFVGDVNAEATVGPMYFTPVVVHDRRIPVPDYDPRPTGVAVRSFSGYIDTDGRLKTKRGGTAGIRLWGNDPEWHLDRFQYRVSADLTDQVGNPVQFAPFYFDAPNADLVKYLTEYMPGPGQRFNRGPAAYILSGAFNESGDLVLTNSDGSVTTGITPPDGGLFLVDNGDGTATLG